MPELSEITENSNNLPVSVMESLENIENATKTSKISMDMCRSNNDKSGDWTENADAWYNCLSVPEEIANTDENNSIEWKHKNLYSLSFPNSRPAYWSPRHARATTSGILRDKKSDVSIKEQKAQIDIVREYLANYQAESYGTPRDEYSFGALIKAMAMATCRSLPALFYAIVHVTPMVQIFLYALRFVLDKIISIRNTASSDRHEVMVRYAIFGLQLFCIYVCLNFIFGLIVMPMLNMVVAILAKMIKL